MSFLKNHPFPVEAYFRQSLVLSFAVPKEQLQLLLPGKLELDTFQDQWGFLAVAMVDTKDLRPKGFPRMFGQDFFLIGYRLFVRYTSKNGKKLRGLYILRSETDKKSMKWLGNLFTHYQYHHRDVSISEVSNTYLVQSKMDGFVVKVEKGLTEPLLPASSPFTNSAEARRFAGPLPHTFTHLQAKNAVLMVEGVRENWTPSPVRIIEYQIPFIESLELKGITLANAFQINDIPYYWKKGRLDQ